MPTKKIWIVSKNPWTAAPRVSWVSISKSSGKANYPAGEFIDVTVQASEEERFSFVDVASGGKSISIRINQNILISVQWSGFVCDLTPEVLLGLVTRSGRPICTRNGKQIFVHIPPTGSYLNNGHASAIYLSTVRNGLSSIYSILNAFNNYTSITSVEWQRYTDAQRAERRNAFVSYINLREFIDIDSMQLNYPTITNTTACPIGVEGVQVLIDGNDNFVADSNNEYITEFQ